MLVTLALMKNLCTALVAAACVVGYSATSQARTERTLSYDVTKVWGTAVRFLRVDAGVTVIEKDPAAGYVLFSITEGKQTFRGSLEMFAIEQDGRNATRFVIQIVDRPSYMEMAMIEKLQQKLRDELGSPAPAPTAKPAPSPTDGK
jgi:hypothetical protein